MTTDMRRTNSYLKGLAETRARSAGDVIRYERLLGELGDLLEKARAEVAWCDGLIKKFDGRLDPTLIPPIHGRSAYGKRGSLKAAMFEILKRESPREVSSTELCLELELRFGLDFPTPKHRYLWRRGTVIRELRRLAEQGLVARLHDPETSEEVGRWRWRSESAPSLDHLRAQVEAQGSSVQQCDADPE